MNIVTELIRDMYDLSFEDINPYREYNVINDKYDDTYILKRQKLNDKKILFIHEIKEYLHEKGFENIDRYIQNKNGDPFFVYRDNIYTLSKNVKGDTCCLENKSHIRQAAEAIAEIHQEAKGFKPSESCIAREDIGKIPYAFRKRYEELKKLKKIAGRAKGKVDCLVLQNSDYFIELAEEAINLLENSKYNELVREKKKEGCFCHHDYTYHNITIYNESTHVKNFEEASIELKEYDIANFIRRKMRRCNWDVREAEKIMKYYTDISSISNDEFQILYILLMFPQKFWRVANKYYNSRKNVFEKNFYDSLKESVDEIDVHKEFLCNFQNINI